MTERNKIDPSSMPNLHDLTNQFDPVKHKVRSFKYKLAATPQNIKERNYAAALQIPVPPAVAAALIHEALPYGELVTKESAGHQPTLGIERLAFGAYFGDLVFRKF